MSSGEHLSLCAERDGDRFSLTRTFETLLDWVADGHFPWQSHAEVGLLASIAAARALSADGVSTAVSVPLAADLKRLGDLYRQQGRERQAQQCFEESTALRQRLLGEDHADTRASRASLAGLLRHSGKLHEAKFLYELLVDDCQRLLGADHPETLAARAGLAATLAELREFTPALALHEQVTERLGAAVRAGPCDDPGQPGRASRHADPLRRTASRARMVYERVLEGRQRLLGSEHDDTLRCTERLAVLLCELGDIGNARKLQEGVVRARERHAGADHRDTLQAREALAEILAAQGDLRRGAQHPGSAGALARTAARRGASGNPEHPAAPGHDPGRAGRTGSGAPAAAARGHAARAHPRHGRFRNPAQQEAAGRRPCRARAIRRPRASWRKPCARAATACAQRGMASGPHESDLGDVGIRPAILEARGGAADPDTLDHKLAQLQQLIDSQSAGEARELADSLRKMVLRPSVASPLRRRGVAMIKQVYKQEGDKDALLALLQARCRRWKGR